MLFKFKPFKNLYLALIAMVAVVLIGSIGFVYLEGYSWIEAFYMTVITVSTVGFREVKELSPTGMIFTSFLIISSISAFAYSISALTTYFVDGEYRNTFKVARLKKEIDKLNQHVIVCGYGRVGEMAVSELMDHDTTVVIIEKDEPKCKILREEGFIVITGDATRDENLEKAGVENAKALIATMPIDSQNLYVILSARERNQEMLLISRASQMNSVTKLRVAGADNVIMPDKVGGAHMASLVAMPDVVEFLDHISIQGGDSINLEEICMDQFPPEMRQSTLGDVVENNRLGINVVGLKRSNGEYEINPGPSTVIDGACKLFVLGTADQIRDLNRMLKFAKPKS
ncbi:MAG TPA: potassium channel protein [Flavobacteriales bacterium]|nr:potassium channel protein [Flavobacteriales bacterium]